MEAAPFLSFCVPTRNRAECLRELLESIAAQATPEIEVVISDDASPDQTAEVVAAFENRLGSLDYQRHDPALRYDRNVLSVVAQARGKFCWLFGDDDRLEPGGLDAVLQALKRDTGLTGLTTGRISFDCTLTERLPFRLFKQQTNRTFNDAASAIRSLLDRLGFLSCQVINRE
ncbi:MAG: glycosyltransferase, partial [Chthoniobacterales bacterium]|nr:glycosyltransferase [Chthoniobacterales bacterium]